MHVKWIFNVAFNIGDSMGRTSQTKQAGTTYRFFVAGLIFMLPGAGRLSFSFIYGHQSLCRPDWYECGLGFLGKSEKKPKNELIRKLNKPFGHAMDSWRFERHIFNTFWANVIGNSVSNNMKLWAHTDFEKKLFKLVQNPPAPILPFIFHCIHWGQS